MNKYKVVLKWASFGRIKTYVMRKVRKNPILVIILLIGLMLSPGQISRGSGSDQLSSDIRNVEVVEELTEETKTIDYVELFDTIVDFVKEKEGFRAKIYYDVNGSKTIGYGHQLQPGENYTSLSKETAEKILRKDLKNRINLAEKTYKLKGVKSYAIGMFIYNCGSGNYERSRLKRLIDEEKPIDKEILKWCHYTYKGKKITSKNLLERRKYELEVYKLS